MVRQEQAASVVLLGHFLLLYQLQSERVCCFLVNPAFLLLLICFLANQAIADRVKSVLPWLRASESRPRMPPSSMYVHPPQDQPEKPVQERKPALMVGACSLELWQEFFSF